MSLIQIKPSINDLNSWRTTATILCVLSVTMFIIQRTSLGFLDLAFEICIFHIPALFALILYIDMRRKKIITTTSF